ncbi:MAG: ABC transporter ATP-binding protein [Chitinispirillaceae bacterium]|nr:ABC transporter ATP-binding protein [Chitinispirillaceae bacterium]
MPEAHVIELSDVRKEYLLGQTRVEALRGVSLTVDKGEFIAIAGPSGSGKSTILNMIGCIDTPTGGRVIINGRDIRGMSDKALTRYRRVTVSFIFQSFNLIPVLDVYENIELPLLLQKISDVKERRQRVMHFIEETGLADRLKNKPGELSGGQRQRVAIARALVTKPVLVLADEPTANLDSATGGRILDLMSEINAREGTTFVFSTHDQKIMEHARRLVRIHDGLISGDEVKGA